jgi:hypothetical protein
MGGKRKGHVGEGRHTICSILQGMRDQNTNTMTISFISNIPKKENITTGEITESGSEEVEVIVNRKKI